MTAAGPVRDSVLNALGYAIRVLKKPAYWWAPALLTAISVVPIFLLLAGMPGMSGAGGFGTSSFGTGGFGTRPTLETQAEIEAYFRTFLPILVASVVVSLVLAPISIALAYRLAKQFVNGEAASPFGPGFIDLVWRFLLQTLAFIGLFLGGFLVVAVVFVVAALTDQGVLVLLVFIAWFVGACFFVVRLVIAPALLASGAGPIESIQRSWQMTRGHAWTVLRWVIVAAAIVGIAASAISSVVSVAFGAIGLYLLGSVIGAVITGPFTVVNAIVLVLLARLLSGPIEPPPPPELPAWMNASGPSGGPPVPPATPSPSE
jgi:hypothetical protein